MDLSRSNIAHEYTFLSSVQRALPPTRPRAPQAPQWSQKQSICVSKLLYIFFEGELLEPQPHSSWRQSNHHHSRVTAQWVRMMRVSNRKMPPLCSNSSVGRLRRAVRSAGLWQKFVRLEESVQTTSNQTQQWNAPHDAKGNTNFCLRMHTRSLSECFIHVNDKLVWRSEQFLRTPTQRRTRTRLKSRRIQLLYII